MSSQPICYQRVPPGIPMAIRCKYIFPRLKRIMYGVWNVCPVLNSVTPGNAFKGRVVRFFVFAAKRMDGYGSGAGSNACHEFIGGLDRMSESRMGKPLTSDRMLDGFGCGLRPQSIGAARHEVQEPTVTAYPFPYL